MHDATNMDHQAAACFLTMRANSELRREWMAEYAIDVETEIGCDDRQEQDLGSMKAKLEALLAR
jgi:hypothetical protein